MDACSQGGNEGGDRGENPVVRATRSLEGVKLYPLLHLPLGRFLQSWCLGKAVLQEKEVKVTTGGGNSLGKGLKTEESQSVSGGPGSNMVMNTVTIRSRGTGTGTGSRQPGERGRVTEQ